MLEKRFKAVPAQAFTSDGSATGVVSITDTSLFKVKQEVILSASTLPNLDQIEVKNILSPTQLVVGPKLGNILAYSNISAYTVALGAAIFSNEQKRPTITSDDFERAVFEEEPTVAKRVILVDKQGNKYETNNPLPVRLSDGSINIGTVNAELDVIISAVDNGKGPGKPHDSIRIGDGTNEVHVNSDGSLNITVQDAPNEIHLSQFNSISSVPSSVLTTVLTYTVPALRSLYLSRIEVSGTNVATYEVYVNSSIQARKRTWFSGPFSETFNFEVSGKQGHKFNSGDVIQVKVVHTRPDLGDFEARLQGIVAS